MWDGTNLNLKSNIHEKTKNMSDSLNKEKIQAEITKMFAETTRINKQNKWYEIVLIMGFATALLAVGKYLL